MEWSKIPTNLINGKSDKEILAIVKYQLLYALYEEEPNKILLSRFLTKKQQLLIQNYIKSIEEIVKNDLKVIQKKRNTNKRQYVKNKEKCKNSDSLEDVCQTEQIREDKIREDNKEKEINKEKEKFNLFFKSFPKQVDEYKTFTLFDTLMNQRTVSFEELMNGVERYKKYCSRNITDEQYIKNPYNWLNDMGWLNEYKDEKKNEKAYSYNAFT